MKCLLCNRHLSWEPRLGQWLKLGSIDAPVICRQCRGKFRHYPKPHCPGCGRHAERNGKYCVECQQWQNKLGWAIHHRCLYFYDDAMKDLMHCYKFQGDYLLRQIFQREMTQRAIEQQVDYIVPIPVTATTMQQRGFNQVEGLLTCSLSHFLTTISREKRAQSTKSRQERLATPQPFQLAVDTNEIRGKRILLVDDVYTTGRTIYHAASLFHEAGAKEVLGLSLAG
ncbi:ComF family protein [Limosilactobacillus sp.]|uniref:ComF family protein n=1 Tax=Limosilactobacillus sp. TaxID=2773925 RepID=UPI00345EA366